MKSAHFIAYFIAAITCCAQPTPSDVAYLEKYGEWEAAAYSGVESGSSVRTCFAALQSAWSAASDRTRVAKAENYATAAVRTAELSANEGQTGAAKELLDEAGRVSKSAGFHLGRGRSSKYFYRTASVQARVFAETNVDPLDGIEVGYELGRTADGFFAIQQSLESERKTSSVAPTEIEDLAANEIAGTLLRMDAKGAILESLPVIIRNGVGSLRSRLTAVLEHHQAGPDGPARYTKREPDPVLGAPTDRKQALLEPKPPQGVQQTTPTKAPDAKPTSATLTEKAKSSTPWAVVAVVVVAAIGFLVVLLKRRS